MCIADYKSIRAYMYVSMHVHVLIVYGVNMYVTNDIICVIVTLGDERLS